MDELNGSQGTPRIGRGSRGPQGPGYGGARPNAGRPVLTQAQRDARKRDRDAIEKARRPAIALLLKTLRDKSKDPQLRVRCAEIILDRTGMPRSMHLESSMDEGDRELMASLRGELGSVIQEIRSDPEAFAIRSPGESKSTKNGTNGSDHTVQ
jgi:hypothetical protein